MTHLRLATRRSPLALAQATLVGAELARIGVTTSLVEVVTTGDRDRVSPVTTLTEVGAFVRAVQSTVLEGGADVAIHSAKDLPVDGPTGLTAFYPPRAAPWDVLWGSTLEALPPGATVGTGSPRRTSQLQALRPDLDIVGIRGNVGTRLEKVVAGEVAAVVLAEAGLARLGRDDFHHRFSLAEMVPAPAQAALALETPRDGEAATALASIDHLPTRLAVETERELLRRTGAGCRSALGALAVTQADGSIRLTGFVDDERGRRRAEVAAGDGAAALALLQTGLGLE